MKILVSIWGSNGDQPDTLHSDMGVSKNRGKTPKMDGENKGKPYEQMDDLQGFTIIFWVDTHIFGEKSSVFDPCIALKTFPPPEGRSKVGDLGISGSKPHIDIPFEGCGYQPGFP